MVFGELSELDEYAAGGVAGLELGEPSGATKSVAEYDLIEHVYHSPR